MFKHKGVRRTHIHNVRLAVLLSLTAGLVNGESFLGFSVLTTNVTGHAALFAEKLSIKDWQSSWIIAFWMILFLAGAFFSSFVIDVIGKNQQYSNLIPISLEIIILSVAALIGDYYKSQIFSLHLIAGSVLFAMGMQNALVSMISKSVVRTTHLTGTFTDLGIEIAQLKFVKETHKKELKSRINLKVLIIFSFILGAILGAYIFRDFSYYSFFAPALILIFALLYDIFRINAKRYYRKVGKRIKQTKSQPKISSQSI